MMHSKTKLLLSLLGFIVLFTTTVYFVRQTFTSKAPGANDFYSRWRGAQLFIREGMDPYSEEASLLIQTGMYGRPALPTEDQVLFVYPFYTIFTIVPLVWLPYDWVQPIWLTTLLFVMVGGIALCLSLLKWKQPLWLLALTMIWGIIFYNTTRTIILGQYTAWIFLWLVGCLWALKDDRDMLAGALLALTTIKPQMSFLLIPAMLLWGWGQKRWYFVGGFAGTMAVLMGVSFILLPSWLTGFVTQVVSYPSYTITGSPLWVVTGYYWPALGKPVEWVFIMLLVGYLLYRWRRLPQLSAASTEFLVVISLTLVITNMIVVRTATTNYVVFYIPLFFGLYALAKMAGNIWVAVFYALSFAGTWALFLLTLIGDAEHPIMYLPFPLLMLFILTLGERYLKQATKPEPQPVGT